MCGGATGRSVVAWALLAALVLTSGCGETPPAQPRIAKRTLAELPANYRRGTLNVSEDGSQVAWAVQDGPRVRLVWNGVPSGDYDEARSLWLARSSKRFVAWASRDGRGVLVSDGTEYPIGTARRNAWAVSRDERRWAFAYADPEGGDAVVVRSDDAVLGRHADAAVPSLSADGAHVAYLAADDGGEIHLVVDGVDRRRFPLPLGPCVVRAQRVGADLGMRKQFQTEFLSDGRIVALSWDRAGWAVYRGDEPIATYPGLVMAPNSGVPDPGDPTCASQSAILAGSLVVAERAPVAAWWERLPGEHSRWRVVRDGTAVSDVDCAWPVTSERIVLSSDGAHVAYLCGEASPDVQLRMSVVLDGRRYGPFRNAFGVVLSDDGRQIAYGALPVDASLDPDVPGWDLRVETKPFVGPFVGVWLPRFGPDGRHVAWEGQSSASERPRVGIDGVRLAAFDEVVAGPLFVTPSRVAWILTRGRRVVWFEAAAPAPRGG